MGLVVPRGRGVDALGRALEEGWRAPASVEAQGLPGGQTPVYRVPAEAMVDPRALRAARRADRLTRMAVLAAWDAAAEGGLTAEGAGARVGVIFATALGPHATTFAFLDGILDYGQAGVSPTQFSHAVHNAAAAYIALALGIRGPALTFTQFHFGFHEAVRMAGAWLAGGRCEAVLVGAAEECGTVQASIAARRLAPPADGRIRPFAFGRPAGTVPGEGAAFFLLTPDGGASDAARIEVAFGAESAAGIDAETGLLILDAGGLSSEEAAYADAAQAGVPVASYAPVFGGTLGLSAFHASAAALTLRRERSFATPVPDHAPERALRVETGGRPVREAVCLRLDCTGRAAALRLRCSRGR